MRLYFQAVLTVLIVLFVASLVGIVHTHVTYPLYAALRARLHTRQVHTDPSYAPSVELIIVAHNEADVIAEKLDNALALSYAGELTITVTSDASNDGTDDIVRSYADKGIRLVACPRGGKVAAQDRAVAQSTADVVAFSDANSDWGTDALQKLIAPLADSEVAYVCGGLRYRSADGGNREGLYWRFELWLRGCESRIGSITGGNGSIYAVKRSEYINVDPRMGHDLAFPYRMVKRGWRAVYTPDAVATENPTPTNEDEYHRKVRMFAHGWLMFFRGGMFAFGKMGPTYAFAIFSHRILRYLSGPLHVVLLVTSIALATHGWFYALVLAAQIVLLAMALAGRMSTGSHRLLGVAQYYVLVSWATVVSLVDYLRHGVPATWERAEGTR